MKKLSVHLVTWNGAKYIPFLFDSLKKQTFKNYKLVILDNGSVDNTVAKIKKQITNFPVEVELIEGKENLGFAKGHNKLVESRRSKVESQYTLLINQDLYLGKDCLEKMVKFMDSNSECAVLGPRVMKWDSDKISSPQRDPVFTAGQDTHNNIQDSFTDVIDTMGLKVYKNRRVVEIGEGEKWSNVKCQMSGVTEVFGLSGAIFMFRNSAVEKIGLFDASLNAYKEDVDLAYRLQSAGYKSFVLPSAVCYHKRTGMGVKHKDDISSLKNKKRQNKLVQYNSYRNHLIVLYKNEYWQNLLLDCIFIKWYEIKKFGYFLLFDRSVLRGLSEIWGKRKEIREQRLEIKKLRKISWKEMRKWFE